jgi:hypothetical protein
VTAAALVAGCHPAIAPVPHAPVAAPFIVSSPNNGQTPPRNECWMSGRFEGTGYLRDNQLELAIARGWIATTRDNDKELDDLHLVVDVQAHPLSKVHWAGLGRSVPVVLTPTVDSAGPQLTTWQSDDTLRLFVPWKQQLGPRWLVFHVDYTTVSHAGRRAECSGSMGSDTIRFAPER